MPFSPLSVARRRRYTMRYIITTATVVALIVGTALGFVVSRSLDGAASAAPAETKVREQNLDGSGLIRVHEQGTANVAGTVNVGNLPAVQDVNVVSRSPQSGRLVSLTLTTGSEPASWQSQIFGASDCGHVSIMARGSSNLTIGLVASPDGTVRIPIRLAAQTQNTIDGFNTVTVENYALAEPFLQVQVGGSTGSNPTAWLWCVP